MTAATILIVIALVAFAVSLLPQVPEKYVLSVAGILLSIAVLIGARV